MKNAVTLFFLIVLMLIYNELYAQEHIQKPIQFWGIVVSSDSLKPIPYTNIAIKNTDSLELEFIRAI